MKKVILSLVFVAAMTVVSCKEKEAEATTEETAVEEVAAPVEEAAAPAADTTAPAATEAAPADAAAPAAEEAKK